MVRKKEEGSKKKKKERKHKTNKTVRAKALMKEEKKHIALQRDKFICIIQAPLHTLTRETIMLLFSRIVAIHNKGQFHF